MFIKLKLLGPNHPQSSEKIKGPNAVLKSILFKLEKNSTLPLPKVLVPSHKDTVIHTPQKHNKPHSMKC